LVVTCTSLVEATMAVPEAPVDGANIGSPPGGGSTFQGRRRGGSHTARIDAETEIRVRQAAAMTAAKSVDGK
jgi:hypothetical protein